MAEGQATVTAAAGDATGSSEITVAADAPRPATVTVTPATARLSAIDATVRLTAEVRDQDGQTMAGTTVTWESSEASVATVDASGQVTAVGNGETTIAATAGSAAGTAVVTVAQEVSAITVSPTADTVMVADTVRLTAAAFDVNGHAVEAAEFDWSSSDASVARVDGSGLVTGVAEGQATITAAAGDATATAEITVTAGGGGSGLTRLTNNPASDFVDGGWSPDGSRILFRSERDGNNETLRDECGRQWRDTPHEQPGPRTFTPGGRPTAPGSLFVVPTVTTPRSTAPRPT